MLQIRDVLQIIHQCGWECQDKSKIMTNSDKQTTFALITSIIKQNSLLEQQQTLYQKQASISLMTTFD